MILNSQMEKKKKIHSYWLGSKRFKPEQRAVICTSLVPFEKHLFIDLNEACYGE